MKVGAVKCVFILYKYKTPGSKIQHFRRRRLAHSPSEVCHVLNLNFKFGASRCENRRDVPFVAELIVFKIEV